MRATLTGSMWARRRARQPSCRASSSGFSTPRESCASASCAKMSPSSHSPSWKGWRDKKHIATAGPVPLGGKFQTNDSLVSSEKRSLDLEVLRGRLSAVLDELVLNGLSFVQRAKSGAFNSRDVHKHILPAFLRLDEAIALRRIEPLNGALRHC